VSPTKSKTLLGDLRQLIAEARQDVARQVNSALVLLYWRVGQRIRQDILKEKRAEYGGRIVSALGRQLGREFGRGFDEKSLRHMIRFAEVFPDQRIVSALRRQLGWTQSLIGITGWAGAISSEFLMRDKQAETSQRP
jgi:DUF1016 N-terminal domain